jgi:hypothetical protein
LKTSRGQPKIAENDFRKSLVARSVKMMRRLFSIAVLLSVPVAVLAAEPADVTPLLTASIIGSDLSMAEVQRYCEARVPRMPELTTAEAWQAEADRLRREVLDRVVFRGQAAVWRDAPLRVEWLDIIEGGPGYKIRKLRYEALPGLWIPALLYLPDKLSEVPKMEAGTGTEHPCSRSQSRFRGGCPRS